jgi:hypothetical protein
VPSLISNKLGGSVGFVDALIRVETKETVITPRGPSQSWRVKVTAADLAETYWFASSAPHELVKMESSDGRSLALKALARKPYWKVPTYRPEM